MNNTVRKSKPKKNLKSDDNPLEEYEHIPTPTAYCQTARLHSIQGFRNFNDTLHITNCRACQIFYGRLRGNAIQGVELWRSGI